MLRILRLPARPTPAWDSIGDALLNWGFLRMGLHRPPSVEELPDHLRRDIGLPQRGQGPVAPRDWRP